jgi:ethanolamine utilization protein EutN
MRVAIVIGRVVLNQKLASLGPGQLLLVEALDAAGLEDQAKTMCRSQSMPQSLVVFDSLGAHIGQWIAVSEGREATAPFHPKPVPIDAFCAAILDQVEWRSYRGCVRLWK